jgi:hypothetical protein
MRALKIWSYIVVALACTAAQAATETNLDKRLVGEWRTVKRLPNGKYIISYYSDAAQTHKTAEVKGMWWSSDKTLFMQPPGTTGKPEAYRYYMIDKNTVRLENTEVDLSAECLDDSTLIDSRVVQE